MTKLSPTAFKDKWTPRFADNTGGAIDEADLREFKEDIADSFANIDNVGSGTFITAAEATIAAFAANSAAYTFSTNDTIQLSGGELYIYNGGTKTDVGSYAETGAGTPPDDVTIEESGGSLRIKDDGVTTNKLPNLAVTTEKLNTNAVTTGKLADNAVNANKLANDAVTTDKILNAQVTPEKTHF